MTPVPALTAQGSATLLEMDLPLGERGDGFVGEETPGTFFFRSPMVRSCDF